MDYQIHIVQVGHLRHGSRALHNVRKMIGNRMKNTWIFVYNHQTRPKRLLNKIRFVFVFLIYCLMQIVSSGPMSLHLLLPNL